MLRRLGLTLLAAVCLAAAAQAQTWEVPKPYAIPLPPSSLPNWELGGRYWWSEGKTDFAINSRRVDLTLGNPTSVLSYDGMNANAGEFFWSARNESNTFAKGFIGAGGLSGGSLDDEDYLAGQIKFLDTTSRLDGDTLIYGTIDVGQDFVLLDNATRVSFGPFVGFNFWYEKTTGYGARCNRDDVGGVFCGPPHSISEPFSSKVITNEANWASLRLGGQIKAKLWDRLTLIGDAAVLPVAYLWNEDSHYLRKDLGPVPNIENSGTGWGYQLEAEARLDLTPNWAVGAGVRYWYAETDGKADFVHLNTKVELKDFTSERFGVFGNVSYRFSTF